MLFTMNKSVAPTELKHNGSCLFYKGYTPTELFPFSKQYRMDKVVISADTSTKLFPLLKQHSTDEAIIFGDISTELYAFSKIEISSAKTVGNRIWDLLFEIKDTIKSSMKIIDRRLCIISVICHSESSEAK